MNLKAVVSHHARKTPDQLRAELAYYARQLQRTTSEAVDSGRSEPFRRVKRPCRSRSPATSERPASGTARREDRGDTP